MKNLYDSYFKETEDEYNNINRGNIKNYLDYTDILSFCMNRKLEYDYVHLNVDEVLDDYYKDILFYYKDKILDNIESKNRLEDSYAQ